MDREFFKKVRQFELRTNRYVLRRGLRLQARPIAASQDSKPIEFDGFGNCGEFAIIKGEATNRHLVLIPSNSTGLECGAHEPAQVRHNRDFNGLEFETFRNHADGPGLFLIPSNSRGLEVGRDCS